MATVDGATLIARSLKQQGVHYMFGVVGFPVAAIAAAALREGITYIGMRNEQAASYAAHGAGYLTARPQACLTVTGPGMLHAVAGLANAQANCWPMLLIGGGYTGYQGGMGAFQEAPQVMAAYPFTKYARQVERAERIPFYVEQAVRTSLYGRPGAAYLDVPDDVIRAEVEEVDAEKAAVVPPPPRPRAAAEDVDAAIAALKSAERPLMIVGKGMAWSRAEHEVRDFVERTQVPFLATPMGKGVVPDDHPLSVAAARSYALQNADLVFLMGARLNWILHFGRPPRYSPDVRVVQLDVTPEEIGTNVPAEAALVGDGRAIVRQLNEALEADPWQYPAETTWRTGLDGKAEENRLVTESMMNDDSTPMNYYRALRDVRDALPRDAVLVSEGANTMDIGRAMLPNFDARTRLDAGTFGTMGVGLGFAIAAAVVNRDRPVVALEGDAAFGFSGMEVEVACRHKLPITFIVFNNGGIGYGVAELAEDRPPPPGVYVPNARYERVIEAFGGRGYHIERPEQLMPALKEAIASGEPSLLNVAIHPRAGRKQQEFAWHTV